MNELDYANCTEIYNAAKVLYEFTTKDCEMTDSTLTLPDGNHLFTDWGYFEEGLVHLMKYYDQRRGLNHSKMYYFETDINKYASGQPTEEEREKLKEEGYTFFGIQDVGPNNPDGKNELWFK